MEDDDEDDEDDAGEDALVGALNANIFLFSSSSVKNFRVVCCCEVCDLIFIFPQINKRTHTQRKRERERFRDTHA